MDMESEISERTLWRSKESARLILREAQGEGPSDRSDWTLERIRADIRDKPLKPLIAEKVESRFSARKVGVM